MRVTVSHRFRCGTETFWRKIFFDRAYNETLFLQYLGFPKYEIASLVETPERIDRVVKVTPPQKAPEIIRKLIKGTLSYEEVGAWTAAEGLYRFRTVPSAMADRIKIAGTIRGEDLPDGAMNRIVDVDLDVRVLLVGGAVERFLAGEIRSSYDKSAAFTSRWIEEKQI